MKKMIHIPYHQWRRDVLHGGHYDGIADDEHVDDNNEVAELKTKLIDDPKEVMWI